MSRKLLYHYTSYKNWRVMVLVGPLFFFCYLCFNLFSNGYILFGFLILIAMYLIISNDFKDIFFYEDKIIIKRPFRLYNKSIVIKYEEAFFTLSLGLFSKPKHVVLIVNDKKRKYPISFYNTDRFEKLKDMISTINSVEYTLHYNTNRERAHRKFLETTEKISNHRITY